MKVLAAISDKEMGEVLLEHLSKRRWSSDTEINFVHVITWTPSKKELESWHGMKEFAKAKESEANVMLDEASSRFLSSWPCCKVLKKVVHGHVGEQLLKYALHNQIEEVIVASHQRSALGSFIFGNVSAELVENLPCALTILKKPVMNLSDNSKTRHPEAIHS